MQKDLNRSNERTPDVGGEGPESATLYSNPGMRARLQASARRDATWEIAAIPLPTAIESDPECRLVAVMVATRDAVLALELLQNLSGEVDRVAAALHGVLEHAMRLTRARPRYVDVTHLEVALALAPLLGDAGIEVQALGGFERTLDPARTLVQEISGLDMWPPVSNPETWAAWQLPETEVSALFHAAAGFFRAAPWSVLADSDGLVFETRDGSTWAGAVMGQGGVVFGISLYECPDDLLRLYDSGGADPDPFETLGSMEGRVYSLAFEHAHELPRPMRREVARKGWEVASPSAFPTLSAFNTPGGGARAADVRVLTEALALVPGFVAAADRSGPSQDPLPEWTSPDGTVVYALESTLPARPPLRLMPGCARGRAARPGAFLAIREGAENPESAFEDAYRDAIELVNRFGTALYEDGMSEPTVMTHVRNSAEFVQFLVGIEGVPLTAVHESDLISFLLDWHPRTHAGGRTRALRMPVSLDRFFGFLEWAIGLQCPWAADVLADRDYIRHRMETAPTGSLLDPEVVAWRYPVHEELEWRLLRPDPELLLEQGIELDSARGANLLRELTRSWLLWREELIESGIRDAEELRDPLVERQREWMLDKGMK